MASPVNLYWIHFIGIMLVVYVLAVGAGMLSQLTYQRKSLQEIRNAFRQTLLKTLAIVCAMAVSFLVWSHMGWRTGKGF